MTIHGKTPEVRQSFVHLLSNEKQDYVSSGKYLRLFKTCTIPIILNRLRRLKLNFLITGRKTVSHSVSAHLNTVSETQRQLFSSLFLLTENHRRSKFSNQVRGFKPETSGATEYVRAPSHQTFTTKTIKTYIFLKE